MKLDFIDDVTNLKCYGDLRFMSLDREPLKNTDFVQPGEQEKIVEDNQVR